MAERTDTERLDQIERACNPDHIGWPVIFSGPFLCNWEEGEPLRDAIDRWLAADQPEESNRGA